MYSQNWNHVKSEIGWGACEDGPLFLCFEYTLSAGAKKTDKIMFAYAHPFNKTDIELANIELEETLAKADPDVYFHKETLINSLEGNPMHLITITRHPGWKELDEDYDTKRDEIDEA